MAVGLAILLWRKPSPNHFSFRLGWDQAILASIGGGWAAHLGNVGTSIAKLRAYVADRRGKGLRVAGYGAGGRGVMTLAAMAQPGEIAYVCDQNPSFHGYLTPGAHVPVVAPAKLIEDSVDEIVVFSFGYFQEIWDSLAEFRSIGGRVISLLDLL